jgi:hypothetical protein
MWLGQGQAAGCCECAYKSSRFIKLGEFFGLVKEVLDSHEVLCCLQLIHLSVSSYSSTLCMYINGEAPYRKQYELNIISDLVGELASKQLIYVPIK